MIKTYVLDSSTLPNPAEVLSKQHGVKLLPAERIEKILRIRHLDAQKQSLGAGLLLHKVLGRLAPDAEVTYGRYGKPRCAHIPFSLSHTKDAVVLSVWEVSGQAQPEPNRDFSKEEADFLVGCDIEQIKPYKPAVARRFFTKAEYQGLEAIHDPQEQAELFCRFWTKKESVMKLAGLGLSLPMDLYDVQKNQVAADSMKVRAWYEKELQKGAVSLEHQRAAEILLDRKLFFKEYRYRGCCITACSLSDRFAPAYEQVRVDAWMQG